MRVKCQSDGKLPLDEKSQDGSSYAGICGAYVAFRCHNKETYSLYVACLEFFRGFNMKRVRTLVFMALFISMDVVLTRMLGITTWIATSMVRISFGFIPIAFSGIMFGPVLAGVTAALSDTIGIMLFPSSTGPYFPGFTVSAFLCGVIYGLLLHKKQITFFRVLFTVLLIRLFVDVGLNTVWLTIMLKTSWKALIGIRLIVSAIMLPVQTVMIFTLWKALGERIHAK